MIDCLEEAVAISVPRAICQLFANILLHCQPSDPKAMYDQLCNAMSEDFLRKRSHALNYSEDEKQRLAWNDLLVDLNSYLEQGDMSNNDFNIPMPNESLQDVTMIEDSMEHDLDAQSFLRKISVVSTKIK